MMDLNPLVKEHRRIPPPPGTRPPTSSGAPRGTPPRIRCLCSPAVWPRETSPTRRRGAEVQGSRGWFCQEDDGKVAFHLG
ncbi:uncharacterized protein UV8b_04231 [Ustilaginoidea virens]|uniref:Uncharacterized protein n=1 Tax=Ustilaginoidea virens TaxID=1159556 RepID=A0A8E5HQV1_USTVR|nr:uncharacterized protein UV8b_04231 [Ustilaginoidea virens]QUC19990.1 hypothetical protein UV8b_04231 [Ustilaginoidea virens]